MQDSLENSVERFGRAWAARDLESLRAMLSPEYVHTDFEGRVFDRDAWLEYATHQAHGSAVSFRDVEYREYGALAIVLGANDIGGGSMGASTIRFTQVWQATGSGGWQRLAFQATLVKK